MPVHDYRLEVPGQGHDAAHGEADGVGRLEVCIGPGLAERAERDDDEFGSLTAKLHRVDPARCANTGRAVLDEDVAGQGEAAEVVSVGLYPAFPREQIRRRVLAELLSPLALHPDHVGAVARQHTGSEPRRDPAAKFEYAYSVEGQLHSRGF